MNFEKGDIITGGINLYEVLQVFSGNRGTIKVIGPLREECRLYSPDDVGRILELEDLGGFRIVTKGKPKPKRNLPEWF